MKKIVSDKNLFFASLTIVAFFGFIYLNSYYFKSDFVLIGVFQEMLTLPLMVLQVALLILASMKFSSSKYSFKNYTIWSLGLLLTSSVLTWGSLFS